MAIWINKKEKIKKKLILKNLGRSNHRYRAIIMKKLSKKEIKMKCEKIKIVLSDVDGVLTDGGIYFSKNGEIMKKFNVRDGMGVELLLRNQINTIIITKENSEIVKQRGKKIKVLKTYLGVSKKENLLDEICKKRKISSSEIAYIGDDINDLEIMKREGFSATPKDGMKEIKII